MLASKIIEEIVSAMIMNLYIQFNLILMKLILSIFSTQGHMKHA